jgi:hypothetical protein
VFIHRTDIAKGNPKKAKKSVGDNEKVEFDIVKGKCHHTSYLDRYKSLSS